jgi:bifunctional UDP-N-acetylglucosamine pyrophosphorylase/glucosamine-1-phosphate N-acetyltransferase
MVIQLEGVKGMKKLASVILAAGESKRMRSRRVKVLHRLMGRSLIDYPVELSRTAGANPVVAVVGIQAEEVKKHLREKPVRFALQKKRLGTGHAVMAAKQALKGFNGDVLILYGDVPLLTLKTIRKLIQSHRRKKTPISLLTTHMPEPKGYGRIIRDSSGRMINIIEEADCTGQQRKIQEVNPGIYCVKSKWLFQNLPLIKSNNKQKEFYLTDLPSLAVKGGYKVNTVDMPDFRETLGVNTLAELARAQAIIQERINLRHLEAGVTMENPERIYIEQGVKIGPDTRLEPDVRLMGQTKIASDCWIQAHARIADSVIEKGVEIRQGSVIEGAVIRRGAIVGPMARLRPGSVVGRGALIGNYVEMKKATVGDGTKAAHLTYLGDARIGKNVNIGCGTITCNYDGEKKWLTVIEDDVFVGSDTQLIAPVRIGKGAYLGSGSTISKDVPPHSLALTRAPEFHKPEWAKKRKKKKGSKGSGGKK